MEMTMAGKIDARIAELKLELPKAAAPVANYVPVVIAGNTAYVSGQVTVFNGEFKYQGKLGKEYTVEDGQKAARMCGLNILAQLRAAIGDLDRVKRICKLGVFVNCIDSFTEQPKVANGVSDLMVEVFGDAGKHARSAIGVNVLPLNVAVEVDAIIELA
jgi:enamine deaminase RidA (YjgF/YER057c/UK114 family)